MSIKNISLQSQGATNLECDAVVADTSEELTHHIHE
jgi:hypothetical protein